MRAPFGSKQDPAGRGGAERIKPHKRKQCSKPLDDTDPRPTPHELATLVRGDDLLESSGCFTVHEDAPSLAPGPKPRPCATDGGFWSRLALCLPRPNEAPYMRDLDTMSFAPLSRCFEQLLPTAHANTPTPAPPSKAAAARRRIAELEQTLARQSEQLRRAEKLASQLEASLLNTSEPCLGGTPASSRSRRRVIAGRNVADKSAAKQAPLLLGSALELSEMRRNLSTEAYWDATAHDSYWLLRHLVAASGSVPDATTLAQQTLRWRAENRLDAIAEFVATEASPQWPHAETVRRLAPRTHLATSRGAVIWVHEAQADHQSAIAALPADHLMTWLQHEAEWARQTVDEASREQNELLKWYYVVDCVGAAVPPTTMIQRVSAALDEIRAGDAAHFGGVFFCGSEASALASLYSRRGLGAGGGFVRALDPTSVSSDATLLASLFHPHPLPASLRSG